MKKLSKITEGILGDIAKRDLAGNERKEDESLEELFGIIMTHCKVENNKISTIRMIDDDILLSNVGAYDSVLHSVTIAKSSSYYDIEIFAFVNRTIIPELYPYFEKQYDGEMKKTADGTKTVKIKIRGQNGVMNFIYDLIDHFDEKLITYHK